MTKKLCEAAKIHQDICQHCDNLYFIKFKKFEENLKACPWAVDQGKETHEN